MTRTAWWRWATMSVGIIAAVSATMVAERGSAREVSSNLAEQEPSANKYLGNTNCKSCHNDGDQFKQAPQVQYFVKYDEYSTWIAKDKHSLAYSNLLDERGRKMAKLLGIADATDLKAGCIGCHGAGQAEATNRIGTELFDPSVGVSCENCHGPSSNWSQAHTLPEFRKRTTEEREKIGLVDLRLPRTQSAQCLSCHIGKADEGKVVTHEMYAAGHPPLPSVEVATFSDVIPRHWWLDGEKPSPKVRQSAGFIEGTKERTRLSLVGAAVALQTSMKLLAEETKASGSSTVPGLAWPDYARFDCWSCHHDLKRESWRQARGYEAAPGRPPISKWPLAIVELGIARLEMDDPSAKALRGELQGHLTAVLTEGNAKPYGRKVPLATAAEQFAAWSEVLIKRLGAASYDETVSLKLLRTLLDSSTDKVVDYDEARHVGWTVRILVNDAGDKLGEKRPAIEAIIKRLETGLNLNLPAGRDYKIEDELAKGLQIIGDYEPASFLKDLKELQALVPAG